MYTYNFDPEKNKKLIQTRGISFEEVIAVLDSNGPIDVVKNHNNKKYSHQQIYVIDIRNYVYMVPFVEEKNEIFLKTIFPNRKATKKYLKRGVE